jgi:hypothetical protein
MATSPLYTAPRALELKARIIKDHGRDADGAYRAYNRIDKKSGGIPRELITTPTVIVTADAADAE